MQKRVFLAVLLALVIPASRLSFGSTAQKIVIDCAGNIQRVLDLPRADRLTLDVHAGESAWLELQESGADVELTLSDTSVAITEVSIPPRLGYFFIEIHGVQGLQTGRALASATPAQIHAKLHCAPSMLEHARVVWFGHAAAITAQLRSLSRDKTPIEAVLVDIAKLATEAVDPDESALAVHLRAQALYGADRTVAAADAFKQAESLWLAAGDTSRALAARVGQVEELQRAGQFQAVLDSSNIAFAISRTDEYYRQRLQATRCVGLRSLGELRQAVACYEASIVAFTKDDERAEVAIKLKDLADALRMQGNADLAEHYAQQSLAMAEGPAAAMLRGRAHLLLADLALDRADVITALTQFDASLAEFSSVHAGRWEANAMLRVASLYTQFGELDDAYAFVEAALTRLSEQDAPARFAAAQVTLARIDMRAGHPENAMPAVRAAEAIYARLQMPVELDICHTLLARLLLGNNDVAAADKLIVAIAEHTKFYMHEWQLLAVRSAIASAQLPRARQLLQQLRAEPLSLVNRIELAELEATCWARSGEPGKALQGLTQVARDMHNAALDMRNPLMAELLVRQILPLRALAIELLLNQAESVGDTNPTIATSSAEAAWHWINLLSAPRAAQDPTSRSGNPSTQLDTLIGRELLGPHDQAAATAMGRELLTMLSMGSPHKAHKDSVQARSLRDLQQGLSADAAFVSYLDAGTRGAMLWVSRDQARLVAAPSSQQLRTAMEKLLALISDPGNSIEHIHAAGDEIAAKLFVVAPLKSAPAVLQVDADSDIGMLPWPILRWWDSDEELVERSSINLVHVRALCCEDARTTAQHVHVFVSAPQANTSVALPQLPVAASEPDFIAKSLAKSQHVVVSEPANNRDSVLAALDQSGDWVHIAGHGATRPDRIGFSGVWLEPDKSDAAPAFLSGLDVLSRGSRSDLVVLDACQLGRRSNDNVRPSISFADATARAGAKHVVAALWPTSDSAAALWVPAFYAAISGTDAADVGSALHTAQLRLRSSRIFHHPFYWASLMHIESI